VNKKDKGKLSMAVELEGKQKGVAQTKHTSTGEEVI
jgi:hypothetical protein